MKKNISLDSNFSSSPLDVEQWNIFQKLITNLSDLQKIWISGYLYGLVVNCDSMFNSFDSGSISDKRVSSSLPNLTSLSVITILFASQTGNSKELAKKLHQTLIHEQFNVRLFNVADYNFKKICQEELLFLIISTYGEGEPPEVALALYEYLFSKNAPNMKNVYFSIFGLGDRSYENFSKAAKDFDFRLEELGGHRFLNRIDVDLDYEGAAENWRREVVCLLKKEFMIFNLENKVIDRKMVNPVINISNSNDKNDKFFVYSSTYTKDTPFSTHLLVRQKITSRDSIKDVYHLEIDLSGAELCYQPGDALGVWYENDPDLIDELLQYFNFTGKEEISINSELLPLSLVLKKYYELTHNTSWVVQKYAKLINNEELLSLFFDDSKLKVFVSSTSIVDMVRCWSPKQLVPTQLLSILRPLTPRFYSISSSQKEVGEEVHITVGVIRYKIDGCIRTGGASGYLVDRLSEDDELRIFILPNESFRLPIDSNRSIIMIAAGTGIAPFRSFMQERFLDSSLGKNWLFFGNVCFLDDFLYQREWQKYVKDGVLTKIDTAWSRDQSDKIYVQDKILQNGLEVWKWIKNGAYVYICGDAIHMARGVESVLVQLGIKYGKMSFEESKKFLIDMRINHRYQKDVY